VNAVRSTRIVQRRRWRQAWPILALASLPSGAAQHLPAGLYDLTIETAMPHLAENLRYTTTREQRCMGQAELASIFPVLSHPALAGCRLQGEQQVRDRLILQLACTGGHGTRGQAVWHFDQSRMSGQLDVRLGGKNMTFYQRVTGKRLGSCPRVQG